MRDGSLAATLYRIASLTSHAKNLEKVNFESEKIPGLLEPKAMEVKKRKRSRRKWR